MAQGFDQPKGIFADRRFQIGAVATVAALAIAGLAVAGADRAGRQDAGPELADHARLAVLVQPAKPSAVPQPVGQLATLDPLQADVARTAPEPVDPQLRAVIEQERLEQMQAVAEQRAFDARIRAEMNTSYSYRPTYQPESEPAAQNQPARSEPSTAHWTSNSEDTAPGV
jgi:hypothetical protein